MCSLISNPLSVTFKLRRRLCPWTWGFKFHWWALQFSANVNILKRNLGDNQWKGWNWGKKKKRKKFQWQAVFQASSRNVVIYWLLIFEDSWEKRLGNFREYHENILHWKNLWLYGRRVKLKAEEKAGIGLIRNLERIWVKMRVFPLDQYFGLKIPLLF